MTFALGDEVFSDFLSFLNKNSIVVCQLWFNRVQYPGLNLPGGKRDNKRETPNNALFGKLHIGSSHQNCFPML